MLVLACVAFHYIPPPTGLHVGLSEQTQKISTYAYLNIEIIINNNKEKWKPSE